jgi:penicillin G amidase
MSLQLATNLDSELKRYYLRAHGLSDKRIAQLMPAYPKDAPTILGTEDLQTRTRSSSSSSPTLGDGELSEELLSLNRSLPRFVEASNNWVVSGKLTASGKPLLANDPHLPLQVPSTWYLAHLESPTLDTTGATIPGFPAVVVGRNESISWGVTTLPADVQDLYIMNETSDGGGYRYQNEVRPYEVRKEKIGVKDAKDVHITVRQSVYGPVISDVVNVAGSKPLSLRWTGLDPQDHSLEALLKVDHAGNWDEFNEALRSYNGLSQNLVYADVDGNIGYVGAGRFPIRKAEDKGLYPVPGNGEWNWRGWIPTEEWPRVLNPEGGFHRDRQQQGHSRRLPS